MARRTTPLKVYLRIFCFCVSVVSMFIFWQHSSRVPNDVFTTTEDTRSLSLRSNSIPRIIHQTWLGPRNMPLQLMNLWNFDYLKTCDGYQYVLWSDLQNLTGVDQTQWDIRNATKLMEDIFHKSYDWSNITIHYRNEWTMHGKSDILRLVVLYLFGGIYIDADSAWVNNKCLNPLLSTIGFAAREPQKDTLANGVMGFTKHHAVIEAMLQYLVEHYQEERVVQGRMVWQVTGPCLLQRFERNITILPSEYFYPVSWHHRKWKGANLNADLYHKHLHFSNQTYMFQYGFTTNEMQWRRRLKKLWHSCYE